MGRAAGDVRLKDDSIATLRPMAGASILPKLALFSLYALAPDEGQTVTFQRVFDSGEEGFGHMRERRKKVCRWCA